MKNTNKLQAYIAMSAGFLAGNKLQAQVLITDYDPDLRLLNWTNDAPDNDVLTIDIDGNGMPDLIFSVNDEFEYHHDLYIVGSDVVTAIFGSTTVWGRVYAGRSTNYVFGASIAESHWKTEQIQIKDADIDFWSSTSGPAIWCSYSSDLFDIGKPYIGFRLNMDGDIHYGWLRLDSPKLLGYDDDECGEPFGSPLTIFESAYEQTPGTPVIANNNKLDNLIKTLVYDANDLGNFSEIKVRYNNYGDENIDFGEVRFFAISDSTEALNFSVAQALALPASNYGTFYPPPVFSDTFWLLPSDMKDIDGNDFNADKKYVLYSMKIPTDGSEFSLTSPSSVLIPIQHECNLQTFIYDVSVVGNSGTAADFEVVFMANTYGEDEIAEYRISLNKDYYDFDPEILNPDQYQSVVASGLDVYSTTLDDILFDVDGNPIVPGVYYIRIWAVPSGGESSLPCIDEESGVAVVTGNENLFPEQNVSMNQLNNELVVILNNGKDSYSLYVTDIIGRNILFSELHNDENNFSLGEFPAGIYFATVVQDGYIVAVKKISVK